MEEQDRIKQFNADMDRLMEEGGPVHATYPEDAPLLELACALAGIDLSGESRRLGAIRQHLVGMVASLEQGPVARSSIPFQTTNKRLRPYRRNHNERHEPMRKSPLVSAFSVGVVTLAVLAFIGLVFVLPSMQGGEAGPPTAETSTALPLPTEVLLAYTVQEGDTLESIAYQFHTTVLAITAANGIDDGSQITVGMTLSIPVASASTEVESQNSVPLSPLQLPNGVSNMLTEDFTGPPSGRRIVFYNQGDDKFLEVIQITSPSADQSELPQVEMGSPEAIQIGDLDGILRTGLSGSITFDASEERTISYTEGLSLTWNSATGAWVEIVSNLSQEDVITFAGTLAIPFAPSYMTYRPSGFYASRGVLAVENGEMITEDRYYGDEEFIIMTQKLGADAEGLAGLPSESMTIEPGAVAHALKIDGRLATLIEPIIGEAHLADNTYFQDGIERTIIASGGGGGGGGGGCNDEGDCFTETPEPEPLLNPPTISFENGIRLMWIKNGVLIDMLSNLPQNELIKVAEGLEVGTEPTLIVGPQTDSSELPKGGVLAGYEINRPQLPQDFFWQHVLTVTEGHGLIIESRYSGNYDNERFAIFTTQKDDGSALPDGQSTAINGQSAVLQSGLSGEALLSLDKFMTLQDGKPRLSLGGGGGGGDDSYGSRPPDNISYTDGKLLTWVSSGARITLLSNLPEDEMLRMAGEATVSSKTYIVINPNTRRGTVGQMSAEFNMWGPTYLPEGLDSDFLLEQVGLPDIVFFRTDSQFVRLSQRAAQPGESLPDGEAITVNGQTAVLGLVSGSFDKPPYLEAPGTISYTDAVQINWMVDGTWIQILANISREEAIRVAESMVTAE